VRGGVIPGQFIPAIEKGVREVLACGAIVGYPVVDVRVVVHDGKHHSVDSKDIAFATAGRKAFMAAIREARPAVLEPIVQIEIAAPEHAVGDVTSDLSSRRGVVTGTSAQGAGTVAIGGQVPEAELAEYQSRLNAMTSGQGRYTIALSHYEAVPPAAQQMLMGQYRVREDD
jgi:elongation factor G